MYYSPLALLVPSGRRDLLHQSCVSRVGAGAARNRYSVRSSLIFSAAFFKFFSAVSTGTASSLVFSGGSGGSWPRPGVGSLTGIGSCLPSLPSCLVLPSLPGIG